MTTCYKTKILSDKKIKFVFNVPEITSIGLTHKRLEYLIQGYIKFVLNILILLQDYKYFSYNIRWNSKCFVECTSFCFLATGTNRNNLKDIVLHDGKIRWRCQLSSIAYNTQSDLLLYDLDD